MRLDLPSQVCRVDVCMEAADDAALHETADAHEAGRRREPDELGEPLVRGSSVLLERAQELEVDSIKMQG